MHAIMTWFDDPRWLRLGMTLVHFVWQGALLGVGAAMLMTWMRGASSHRRYQALLVVFALMAAAPIVTYVLLPAASVAVERLAATETAPMPPEVRGAALPVMPAPAMAQAADASMPPGERSKFVEPAATSLWASIAGQAAAAWRWTAARVSWLVAAWLAGVAVFTVRFAIGWLGARRIRRIGLAAPPDACRWQCSELSKRLGLRQVVSVFESALVQVPVVLGSMRPVVLLPASVLSGLSETELRAILAHELAHIRRHDYLINMLQTAIETLLFYHPAVWWISRAIRQEREQCCDDLAAEICGDRVVVAKALVRLAEVHALPATAMAATRGRLAQRVRRLLGSPPTKRESTAWRSTAGSSLACLAASLVAAFCLGSGGFTERRALAQEAKPTAVHSADGAGAGDSALGDETTNGKPGKPLDRVPYLSKLFQNGAGDSSGGVGDEGSYSGPGPGSPVGSPDADRLSEQLRRLEKQNEETRRELRRLEERLNSTRGTPHVESPLRPATDADIRQARLSQLREMEQAESANLAGKWTTVPASAADSEHRATPINNWEFRDHDVALNSSLPSTGSGQSGGGLSYFINPGKSPKEMTIVGKNMLIQAIYKLDGDTLTVGFFGRSEVDRPTSFKPTKDNALPLIVLTFHRIEHSDARSH